MKTEIKKTEGEIKPIDKEKQKKELEKSLQSIRRFNQIIEDIKKSYDEHVSKTKQNNGKRICVSRC